MTTFNIIEPEDIMTFVEDNVKSDNDTKNKKRESILSIILNVSEDYLDHHEYGVHWTSIRNKLHHALQSLCPVPFDRIGIEQKGGMSYNYDFVVSYYKNLTSVEPVYRVKLEFKNNNSSVKDLVQFLELYDKDCQTKYELFHYSYSEYYYDNYLDKYLEIDGTTSETETRPVKPSKEDYLKHVYDIKYKHPFFNHIYTNKMKNKKEKEMLVEESRKKYIKTFAPVFQFTKLTQKIIESQSNKVFLLWDKNNFHIQTIDVSNIYISGIKNDTANKNKLYFDVCVKHFVYDIRIRLNWGNNNGIANPRWKFTFIDK
jgi:hypothetical protein